MPDDSNPFSRDHNPSNQSSQQQHEANQRVAAQNAGPQKKSLGTILMLVLGFFAACLICCGAVSFFAFKGATGLMSAPVDAAIAYVSADEEIANKLGTPIESTSAIGIENYQNNNGNGSAKVGFNAKGPNGTARVDGSLTLTAGTWSAKALTVKFPDGQTITLPRDDTQGDPIDQEESAAANEQAELETNAP
jgi:hypothetical protein